jgi:hypothetical protein
MYCDKSPSAIGFDSRTCTHIQVWERVSLSLLPRRTHKIYESTPLWLIDIREDIRKSARLLLSHITVFRWLAIHEYYLAGDNSPTLGHESFLDRFHLHVKTINSFHTCLQLSSTFNSGAAAAPNGNQGSALRVLLDLGFQGAHLGPIVMTHSPRY